MTCRRCLLVCAVLLLVSPAALRGRGTTTDLLVPYFEVDLDGRGRTALVAVGNAGESAAAVVVTVTSDWGIALLVERLELAAGEVATFNLRDWLLAGRLPSRALSGSERAHLAAALSGRPSPSDGLLYGSAGDGERAVGAVTLRLAANRAGGRPPVLWGDVLWVDPREDRAEGNRLVDIAPGAKTLCDRHFLRFLSGGGFAGGTELVLWSGRRRQPAQPVDLAAVAVDPAGTQISIGAFHRESGESFALRELDLPPVAVVDLGALGLVETAGWVDLISDGPVYAAARYRGDGRFSVGIETWCQGAVTAGIEAGAAVSIETLTAGEDADSPPGAILEARQPVTWTYVVTNTGGVPLAGVVVTDRPAGRVACPKTTLAPGESMVCTRRGTTIDGGFYDSLGTVVAVPPEGPPVTASDPSYYYVPRPFHAESIDIELAVNGVDADTPPGPSLPVGSTVIWSYSVTNTGNGRLTRIQVDDARLGPVACPATTLAPGESMTCSLAGTAELGLYATEATAIGTPPVGPPVEDRDPGHYTGI